MLIFEILVVVAVLKVMLDFTYKAAQSESVKRAIFATNIGLISDASLAFDGTTWTTFPWKGINPNDYECDIVINSVIFKNKNFSWKIAEGRFHPFSNIKVECPLNDYAVIKYNNKLQICKEVSDLKRTYPFFTSDFSSLKFEIESLCENESSDISRELIKILDYKGRLCKKQPCSVLVLRCDGKSTLSIYHPSDLIFRDFARSIANVYEKNAVLFSMPFLENRIIIRYDPTYSKEVLKAIGKAK